MNIVLNTSLLPGSYVISDYTSQMKRKKLLILFVDQGLLYLKSCYLVNDWFISTFVVSVECCSESWSCCCRIRRFRVHWTFPSLRPSASRSRSRHGTSLVYHETVSLWIMESLWPTLADGRQRSVNFRWHRCYHSIVCLSVCLSVFLSLCVMFVHCAQMAEDINTISSAYVSPMSLPDRVKIWLTLVNSFLPIFCPKVTQPCWFQQGRHSMANCGWMVRYSALLTMDSL